MQVNAEVELVDGAGDVDEIAEMADHAFAKAREPPRTLARFPSAARRQPPINRCVGFKALVARRRKDFGRAWGPLPRVRGQDGPWGGRKFQVLEFCD